MKTKKVIVVTTYSVRKEQHPDGTEFIFLKPIAPYLKFGKTITEEEIAEFERNNPIIETRPEDFKYWDTCVGGMRNIEQVYDAVVEENEVKKI